MKERLCTFHEKLKECLELSNISQQQLANEVGTTQATVNRWIKGINQPDYDTLLFICYFFNISPSEILGYNDFIEEGFPYESIYGQVYIERYEALCIHKQIKLQGGNISLNEIIKQMKKRE